MSGFPETIAGPPIPSLQVIDAGLTIPRRSFDRWTMGAKPPQTFLTAGINNAVTSIAVAPVPSNGTSVATFPTGTLQYLIQIDSEQMLVTAGQGTLTWTVVRGVNGTAKAAHSTGVNVLGSAITNLILVGDSTMQGTVGANDEFAQRMSRMLGRTMGGANGLVGRGFRGLWLSDNNPNMGSGAGNSLTEWTSTGTWTLVTPGGVDDLAPWGWCLNANGVGNVLIWTRPANITVAAIEVFFVQHLALNIPSYSTDGGATWNAFPTLTVGLDTIVRFVVTTANPTDFRIRAATAAGGAVDCNVVGISAYSVAPTFGVTQGVMVHNLGMDLNTVAQFARANASGDDFALFDGDSGSILPDLVVLGPFTNDVIFGLSNIAGFQANLTACINRFAPYADILCMNYCEQDPALRPSATQAAYRAALKRTAASLNVGVLDIYDAFAAEGLVGFAACNAAGLMFDQLHCNQAGNNDIAARIMRALGLTTL